VTISAKEDAFFQFFFDDLPFFIGDISDDKILIIMIDVVELECRLISFPSAVSAFFSQ